MSHKDFHLLVYFNELGHTLIKILRNIDYIQLRPA